VAKSKRKNYLIDKPFQIGFIFRFILIIIISVIIAFGIILFYYWFKSNVGEYKLDTSVILIYKGQIKFKGSKVYKYPVEQIDVYEEVDNSGNKTYKCFKPYASKYKQGDVINNIDVSKLEPKIDAIRKNTTMFWIVFYPLLFTCIGLILIIAIYSLFFSHRMAGPIYRLRVSLDRMISGDYDFKIRARKTDFFLNIIDRLEKVRQQIQDKTKK